MCFGWDATRYAPYVEPSADHALADWIKFLNTKLEEQRWSWHLAIITCGSEGWIIRNTKIIFQREVPMTNTETFGKGLIVKWRDDSGNKSLSKQTRFTHNERVAKEKEDINTGLQHPHLGHHYHLREIFNQNDTNIQCMHLAVSITEISCSPKERRVDKLPLRKWERAERTWRRQRWEGWWLLSSCNPW